METPQSSDIPVSKITPKEVYMNRRRFMAAAAALGAAALAGESRRLMHPARVEADDALATVLSKYSTPGLKLTPFYDITHYNNFYEFGVQKGDPAANAWRLKTRPWTIKIEGAVRNEKTFDIDTLLKLRPMEQRVYRFRCVEAWSMVIPWAGYSLSELINECEPLPSAKFVQFLSLDDSKDELLPWNAGINWPYKEGLRMDEAMHPLTLLAFGLYGQPMPKQDGAPVRVVVPWKYGFKSAKSIVKVRFVNSQPETTWNDIAPDEYGFYSNVNPNRPHPRWSQKTERVIGAPIWKQLQPTLMFNGYGDQVAHLYKGMNLMKDY
jgi:methionine sulfoxide reductase catalytic subunit